MKKREDLLSLVTSKKLKAVASIPNEPIKNIDEELAKLKELMPVIKVGKEHKDRTVKKKPKPCWIYLGTSKEDSTILLTQVRHTEFKYVEDCETYFIEHFSSYIIKDSKGNVLIKV